METTEKTVPENANQHCLRHGSEIAVKEDACEGCLNKNVSDSSEEIK